MEAITAFKCAHCGKLSKSKESCHSHEYRCYLNPRTKSCASCSSLEISQKEYKPGYVIDCRVCLAGFDISKKMKTGCSNYNQRLEELE